MSCRRNGQSICLCRIIFFWVARVNHAIYVKMSDGSQVFGNRGDYVVLNDDDDLIVVSKQQFNKEYQKILSHTEINAITHALTIFEEKETSILDSIKLTTPLPKVWKPSAPRNKRPPSKPLSELEISTRPIEPIETDEEKKLKLLKKIGAVPGIGGGFGGMGMLPNPLSGGLPQLKKTPRKIEEQKTEELKTEEPQNLFSGGFPQLKKTPRKMVEEPKTEEPKTEEPPNPFAQLKKHQEKW